MAESIRKRGAIILGGTGTPFKPEVGHLHFALKDVDSNGFILLAPVGTKKPNSDLSCVLQVGHHPFIRHESVILYARLRLMKYGHIVSALRNGNAHLAEAMSPDLHTRVCACLRKSKLSPGWAKKYLGKNGEW